MAEVKFVSVIITIITFVPVFVQCLENVRPIIGVIAEETYSGSKFLKYGSSSIVASYVKFLEAGGARVVPIMIYQPVSYYDDIMSKINGVLFPGGGVPMDSSGYGRTGKIIFDLAIKLNDKNDYFPLWGTCLGFELLNYLASSKNWMKTCAAEDLPSPVELVTGFSTSRMFQAVNKDLLNVMKTSNVSINYHQWCLTPKNFTLAGLDKYFKILSYGKDARNETFVSIVEAHKYPFYGVAFHPEKVLFEWVFSKSHRNIPHSKDAIRVSQYFANFFVDEARKSKHKFPSKAAEDEVLIFRYNPIFTGKFNSSTVQTYYFNISKYSSYDVNHWL